MSTSVISVLLTVTQVAAGNSFTPGDVLISRGSYSLPGTLLRYDSAGALVGGGAGSGRSFFGVAALPTGQVAVTARQPSRVHVFDGSGSEVLTFATPQVTNVDCGDLAAFSDGTMAVCDLDGNVDLYSRSGEYVATWSCPGMAAPFGAFVDGEDRLWVSDLGSIGAPGGAIFAFDRAGGVVRSWTLAFEPGDLVCDPDGDVWTVDRLDAARLVVHLGANGQSLGSFPTLLTSTLQGIGRNADGSLWVCAQYDARARRFSTTGVQLDEFVIALGVGWANLLTVFPEPLPPTRYCTAGTTANGCAATLSATGTPSASLSSGFVLHATHVDGARQGVFFYSNRGAAAWPWATGSASWFCMEQPTQRTTVQNSGGAAGACDGRFDLDFGLWAQANPSALGSPFIAGEALRWQAWFRDPAAVRSTSLSDALVFSLTP